MYYTKVILDHTKIALIKTLEEQFAKVRLTEVQRKSN